MGGAGWRVTRPQILEENSVPLGKDGRQTEEMNR